MKLTQGPVTADFDERLANLWAAYYRDTENSDRGTVLWLIDNLQHARKSLRKLAEVKRQPAALVLVRNTAKFGLEVQGE